MINPVSTAVIFILFFLNALNAIVAGAETRVIQDNKTGFVFEASFDAPQIIPVTAGYTRFVRVGMNGLKRHSLAGRPDIPCENYPIGIPPGSYQVSVTLGEGKPLVLESDLLPGEDLKRGKGETFHPIRYSPAPSVYSLSRYPEKGAMAWTESRLGAQRILHVTLFPVVCNPSKRQAVFYERIRVQVSFSGTGVSAPDRAYDAVLSRLLLNYNTAKALRSPPARLGKAHAMQAENPFDYGKIYKVKIKSSSEFSLDGEGLYRVTAEELSAAGGSPSNVDVDDIKVFTSGYGMVLQPVYTEGREDSESLVEIPVCVVDVNGNGLFDGADQIRFYAQGGAAYRFSESALEFRNHPFDYYNYYWIVLDAKSGNARRIDTGGVRVETFDTRRTVFYDWVHREGNIVNPFGSDESYRVLWVWSNKLPAQKGISFTDPLALTLTDAAEGITQIRPRILGGDYRPVQPQNLMVLINGTDTAVERSGTVYESGALHSTGPNTIAFGFSSSGSDSYFIDAYDLVYPRKLNVHNGSLLFYGEGGSGTIFGYAVSGLGSGNAVCLDVSNPLCPVYARALRSGDTAAVMSPGYAYNADSLRGRKFCVAIESALKIPSSIEYHSIGPFSPLSYRVRNLRSASQMNGVDYVVICPQDFYSAARRLAQHRTEYAADAADKAMVVFVEDIYDQFSGGKTDFSAIRDFLMYSARHSGLRFAVLMGNGHYDFKDYAKSGKPNLIPPYEAFTDTLTLNTPMLRDEGGATDDFYAGYDEDTGKTVIFIGRLPAGDQSEADEMVNKIIEIETDVQSGKEWCNRALFLADDDHQITEVDPVNAAIPHMQVTEDVSAFFPSSMEKLKVYLQQYSVNPLTWEKPDAELALIDRINDGVRIWAFVGHGDYNLLTSEKVFSLQHTLPRFQNYGKYGFFWAASCMVGEYDDPNKICVCQKLLTVPGAGMSAAVGASRMTNAGPNQDLMRTYFKKMFDTTAALPLSLGQTMALAKEINLISNSSESNHRVYNLFGDPAAYPYPNSGILSIDGHLSLDTMKALQRLKISGTISDKMSAAGSGIITIRLSGPDAIDKIDYQTTDDIRSVNAVMPGAVLSSTAGSVKNGRFSVDFVVPKNIPFGMRGGRLSFFAWYGGRSAAKSVENIYFSAEMPDSVSFDTVGPAVNVYVNGAGSGSLDLQGAPAGESFTLNSHSLITVVLDDPDGIRTQGSLVNEGLLYEFTGLFDRRRVTSVNTVDGAPEKRYFTLNMETELHGTTEKLAGKTFDFVVLAQDNYDNRTRKVFKVFFAEDSAPGLSSKEVYNYPNPFTDSTRFIWRTASPADVSIRIYTQSGRLIRILKSAGVTGPYASDAQSVWDGRDEAGHRAARGIYFFSLSLDAVFRDVSGTDRTFTERAPVIGKMMKQ